MTNNAVILAGGQGKRMKADIPKPLFKVLGETMLDWVLSACKDSALEKICVVKGFMPDLIDEHLQNYPDIVTVLQEERLGTAHAVMQARDFLQANCNSNTLVLCGDAPFIDSDTIKNALELHEKDRNAVTVITANVQNPTGYGRIMRDGKTASSITAIVEESDATIAQRAITEINSGAYWFKTADLLTALEKILKAGTANSLGEFYLTDSVYMCVADGKKAGAYLSQNPRVVLGANSRKDLLLLNNEARMMVIEKHLENGVEFLCTDGVTIGRDVTIGVGTEILQGSIISGKTTIGENCRLGPNVYIEDCKIGNGVALNEVQAFSSSIEDNVKAGPYVHIRPDCVIKRNVKIGDFVEIKNSVVGEFTSIAHLTYIGDSDIGRHVNFGCGCVTVNYDGVKKSRCVVGDSCFIGCNTNLIAPVTLGKAVYTAAGTTIVKDVPDYALAIDRGNMSIRSDYSKKKLKNKIEKHIDKHGEKH